VDTKTPAYNDATANRWVGTATGAITFNNVAPFQFQDEQGNFSPPGDTNAYANVGSYTADKDGNIYFYSTADQVIYRVDGGLMAPGTALRASRTWSGPAPNPSTMARSRRRCCHSSASIWRISEISGSLFRDSQWPR